jgi:KaiC/GvpD/RAD55 family RecA-like ATPase
MSVKSRPLQEVMFISRPRDVRNDRLPSSGVPAFDKILGGQGFPDKSAVLIIGSPGVNKEALGYWFASEGLRQGDTCLYVTRLSVREVENDWDSLGVARPAGREVWIAREGGQTKLEVRDLPRLLGHISTVLEDSGRGRVRIVLDALSSILMVNSLDAAYDFVDSVIVQAKAHDASMLATLEEGMHPVKTQTAMQQAFDGFVEMSVFRTGLKILPLLRVGKMRGANPLQGYYVFSFGADGMKLEPAYGEYEIGESQPPLPETSPAALDVGPDARAVFDYLAKSFVDDFKANKLSMEQSGWRTRTVSAKATGLTIAAFYAEGGRFGPVMKELLSSGLVETRFFPGQRGRGGEVIKVRVAYEKELVKRIVNEVGPSLGATP